MAIEDIAIRLTYDATDFVNTAELVVKHFDLIQTKSEETNKKLVAESLKARDALDKVNETIAEEVNELKKATKEVVEKEKAEKKSNEETKKASGFILQKIKNIRVLGVSIGDIIAKYEDFGQGLKETFSILRGGLSISDRQSGLIKKLTGNISESSKAHRLLNGVLKLTSIGFNVLKVAIAATGIGLLVVALGSLVAVFGRTQKGADGLARIMNRIGTVFNVLGDRAASFGQSIIGAFRNSDKAISSFWTSTKKFLSNPVDGVVALWGKARDAVRGFFDEVNEETTLSDKLFDRKIALREAERALRVDAANARAEIKALNKDAEDVTLSIAKRQNAAAEAIKIEQGLLERKKKIKEEELAILREENKLAKDQERIDFLDKEADLLVEIANLQEESGELQTTLNNKNNILVAEQARAVQNLKDRYNEFYGDLEARLQELDLQESDPITRLQLQQAIAIKTLEDQRDQFLDSTKLSPEDRQKAIDGYAELIEAAKREFARELFNLQNSTLEPLKTIPLQGVQIVRDQLEQQSQELVKLTSDFQNAIITQLGLTDDQKAIVNESFKGLFGSITDNDETDRIGFINRAEDFTNQLVDKLGLSEEQSERIATFYGFTIKRAQQETESEFESFLASLNEFKKNIIDSLGLTDEDLAIIDEGFSKLFAPLADVSYIDNQIEANRRYREELAKTTENIEDQLEEQQSLREQGLANDVDLLEKALNEQNALQEKAQKEAEELQRKRARAELISNLASQVSNLATAATKIFSAHSGIPFAGVAIAIGAIASMYSAFKQFKAEASADVSLHTGTGRGRRVSDYFGYVNKGGQSDIPGRGQGYRIEGTNVRIGGDEFLSTEEATRAQGKFLADLNENPNRYKGIDINEVIREYHYNKIKEKENKSTFSGKDAKVIHLKDFKSLQNSSLIKELAVINNSENKKDSQIITVFDNQNTIDKVLREKLSLKESIIQNNNDLVNNSILKEKVIKEYAALEKNLSGMYHNVYDILNYHYGNADQLIENNTINVMNLAEYLRSYDNTHHKSDIEIAPGITEKITSNYLKVKELVSNISYDTKTAQSNYEKSIVEKSDSPTVKEISKKLDSVISELTHIRNKPTTYSIADNTKKIVKEWPGRKETVEL